MVCPAETNLVNPHLEETGWVIAIQTHTNISVGIGWSTNISDWSACPDNLFLHPGSHNFHYQVSQPLLVMSYLRKNPELMMTRRGMVPFIKIPPNPRSQHLQ